MHMFKFCHLCVQRDLDGLAQCLSLANPSSIPKTLVFFGNKKQVVQAYIFLRNRARKKHYVGAYHASLTSEMKQFVLRQFVTSDAEMRVLCSTIAFGMVLAYYFFVCASVVLSLNFQGIDIPDIRVVIIYWVPDTISQFYQVQNYFTCTCINLTMILQLSGRAGRNNDQSLCVLYYNSKQKVKDIDLKTYCSDKDKENCRRVQLLQALGDANVQSCDLAKCCDRCNCGGVPVPQLRAVTKRSTQARQANSKRRLEEDDADTIKQLRDTLITERNKIISSSPGLTWLGPDHVCSDKIISIICERAHLIKTVADLSSIPGLWRQLHEPIYNIIVHFPNIIPPPTKK